MAMTLEDLKKIIDDRVAVTYADAVKKEAALLTFKQQAEAQIAEYQANTEKWFVKHWYIGWIAAGFTWGVMIVWLIGKVVTR
jgi:hypothetical protein